MSEKRKEQYNSQQQALIKHVFIHTLVWKYEMYLLHRMAERERERERADE
jgi:hypothetical protein